MSTLSPSDPSTWAIAAASYDEEADKTLVDGGPCVGAPATHFANYGELMFYCYLMHAAASAGDL
jgi:hypothetical protein